MANTSRYGDLTVKAFGAGMAGIVLAAGILGGAIDHWTSHATRAPAACTQALDWADQIMADSSRGLLGSGDGPSTTAIEQYTTTKGKCRDS